jgi:hypothetical protein
MKIQHILVAILALPASAIADTPWDKPPQQWKLSETYLILTDSPWAPSKSQIHVAWVPRRMDPLTKQKTDLPINPQGGEVKVGADIGRSAPLPDLSVLWWSAKTVRLAQQRLRQLRDPAKGPEPLRADDLNDFVLVVEGTEPLRVLRDAVENLRETVFLELPNGMPLDVAEIRFIEGETPGENFVAFHFPRQIEGRITVSPDAEKVVFHCKATAKNARLGRPDAFSIRATFEPRKMRAAGQPDL